MKKQFDRNVRSTPEWNVGDYVWLNSKNISTTRPSPKLGHRWLGPFPICAKISQEEPEPVVIKGEEEWEVVEILDCRRKRGKQEYLIAWKGYGPQDNSWEPAVNLTHCQQLLKDFDIKFPEAEKRHTRSRRFR
ncbi:hypothetical protein PtA15_9A386 [Puccinia triticina]|uniref:Chromo domain-containing protein n=1 Tax=Puccinia triticina TaxID=208348 RepID=A0ABY7CSK2_9BASI|nr:uncharacterized protein PtA15_9A386 [Puccinia triticina]WAQ88259.1 hypothetical protein PtA15_9A386 [Puccinia triticina]